MISVYLESIEKEKSARAKERAETPRVEYQENPMWELWQKIEKPRPYTSADSIPKTFLRGK